MNRERGDARLGALAAAMVVAGVGIAALLWAFDGGPAPAPRSVSSPSAPVLPGSRTADAAANGRIAYLATAPGGGLRIVTVEPDGSDPRVLAPGPLFSSGITWSPDGRRLAVGRARGEGAGELDVVAVTGGAPEKVSSNPSLGYDHPAWSPNGAAVAFTAAAGDLDVLDPASGAVRVVVAGPPGCAFVHPSWSPDASRLVASLQCPSGGATAYSLVVVPAAGGGPVTIVGPVDGPSELGTASASAATLESPAWSPDGRLIAYASRRAGRTALLVVGADGSGARPLTDGADDGDPAWSPDGRVVVFVRGSDLWTVRPDGAGATRLTETGGAAGSPAWQPVRTAP